MTGARRNGPGTLGEQARVTFTGSRWRLAGILIWGYILMLPTLGIYRFWQITRKRRFYWAHTQIDGDALEYTGTARQLLIGFLIALVIFLPLYGLFFYLSIQSSEAVIYGYSGAAVFLFFLSGYALYRARRFRLTRTLWRGIRFHQSGSAWSYAFRRFFWFLLSALTLGLAYPFMAASLWRYRYENTWYGDRQFGFEGSWKDIAAPFYKIYFSLAALGVALLTIANRDVVSTPGVQIASSAVLLAPLIMALVTIAGFAYFYLLSRFTSRLLSKVTLGRARLSVRIKARALFGQYLFYSIMLSLAVVVFLFALGMANAGIIEPMLADRNVELSSVLKVGWYNIIVLGLMYLAFMAALTLLSDTIIGLGYWRLIARGAVIQNPETLRSVRAGGEESTLVGEGLADALNVGAY